VGQRPSDRALGEVRRPAARMRVLVHDFSGHPFQIDLSRRLAARGHHVLHVHCPSYTTGKGWLSGGERLEVEEISLGREFARYSPFRRLEQEIRYGMRFTRVARRFGPDVIISCNDPLIAKAIAGVWMWRRRIPWIYWLQDLYSVAMSRELEKRGIPFSRTAGRALQLVERMLLRSANAVVAITKDFLPLLCKWGVDPDTCTVVENWAPIDELPTRPRDNSWRADVGLDGPFTFVYSGTLGLKHDPDLLYALADHLGSHRAEVVVVSEGRGVDRLNELQSSRPLSNLRVLPFQPYVRLPDVLGAADVLLVLLEPEAGTFSVPSKVLTSLCSGRPILAMMPSENLAAMTIERAGAGRVVVPQSPDRFCEEAVHLLEDEELRRAMGRRARDFAEVAFDGEAIADRFESVLVRALNPVGTNG
jgi:colanic acid biosynthesis glycosyl transferase WcaI